MTSNRNAAHHPQPTRPAFAAGPSGRRPGGSQPRPGRAFSVLRRGSPARRRWLSRRSWLALAAGWFALSFGAVAQAALSASPNPSATGAYTVSWTAIADATRYHLYEDGTLSYAGTARSKAYSGKDPGAYTYTLTYCLYVAFPFPAGTTVCDLPSNFDAVEVTVSDGDDTPTVPAAPVLTVPETSTTGSYTVSWTRPSGATAYRLEERAGSGDWRPVHRGAAASKSFSNKRSGSYAYRARACAGTDNCGDWSATGTIAVTRATSTLSATPNPAPGGNFTVRWTASAVSSLYRLQESVDGGAAVQVYAGSARSQRFTGKAPASYDYSLKVCFSLFGNEVCLPSGSVTVTVPEPDPTGSISAAPSPCVIVTGQNRCTTTVTWSTEHVNRPCIFMSVTQALFACGASGSNDAPWIGTAGSTFLLKVDNTFSSDTLDSATVAGVREPTVTASFDEQKIALRGSAMLTWSSQHASTCRRSPGNVASAVSGTHVYTPGRAGEFRVTVTCAGAGGSAEDTATVDVNTPPEAADDIASTGKNTAVAVSVLGNDRDPDGDALRVVSATRPAHGTTRVNNGRTVTYTPNANHVGSDSFDYTISDEMDTHSATVAVTITAPAPTVSASFDPSSINLGEHSMLTWSSTDASTCRRSPGNVASAVSGTHAYTPGRAGEFRVTVTCAGAGGSGEDTATVDVNTPPEAADDTGTTGQNESVTVRVLTNDRDADNDPLRVVSATRPTHGTTRVNNGRTVTYTPDANHVGSDSFDYTISDEMDTDSATVTVTVTPTASVPNAPGRPNVEAAGARSLTVTWTAPSDNGSAIVDYDIGYRVGETGGWTPHPFTGDGTSTAIGGLHPYTLYTVRVRAENDVGESAWSEPGSDRTDDVVPGRPNAPGVEATGSTTLSVTWAAPVNRGSDITDYDIEYKTSTATRWEEYDFTGTGRTTTIAGLTPATTYQVRVRAENGHGESPYSPPDEATTDAGAATTPPVPDPFDVPETDADGDYAISWGDSAGATRYELKEKLGSSGAWEPAYEGAATTVTLTGRGITASTAFEHYAYRVRACNGAGDANCSGFSDEEKTSVTGALSAEPNPSADGAYTVRWTRSLTATGYRLEESTDGGATWPGVYSLTATEKAFAGKAHATYTYRVRACVGLGFIGGVSCRPLIPSNPEARLEVVVGDPRVPAAPAAPAVTAAGATSLTVIWTAPSDNGSAIVDYDVGYRIADSGAAWTDHPFAGTATTTTVDGLERATAYEVRVRAANAHGESGYSDPGEGSTPAYGSVSADPETCFIAPGESRCTVTVTWAAHGTGTACVFVEASQARFACALRGARDAPWITAAGSTFLLKAGDAFADTTLASVDVRGVPDTAPGRPDDPAISATGARTLSVTWTEPANAGSPIAGYELQYRERDADSETDAPWTTVETAGDVTATTLSGLTPGTAYEARVRASNGAGPGAWSAAVEATTDPEGTPDAPDAPAVTAAGATSLDVAWTAPSDNGSAIHDYDVEYGVDGTGRWTPHPFTGDGAMTTIGELRPHTLYTVRVRAANALGEGPFSEPGSGRTDDVVPGRPDRPRVTASGGTTLSVTWTEPANAGSPIAGYELQYRERDADSEDDAPWTTVETAGDVTATTLSGLTPGTAYEARVRASNGAGPGAWSAARAATTDAAANRPPEAADDTATTAPGTPVTVDVLANDADPDRDALTVALASQPQHGAATVNADGTVTYTPEVGHVGEDRFDYTVSDGAATDTATVTVTVSFVSSTLTVTPNPSTDGRYTVRWTAPGFGSTYRLDESADGGAAWTAVYSGTGLETTISGQDNGIYHYRLYACVVTPFIVGNLCVPAGGPVPARVALADTPGVPGTPGDIQGPSTSPGHHELSWPPADGTVTRYELHERRDGGAFTVIQDSAATVAAVSGRSAGAYRYRVRACNGPAAGDCGPFTPEKPVAVLHNAITANPNPSPDGAYTVCWSTHYQATSYRLYEDGVAAYEGADACAAFTGRAPGAYVYTVDLCIAFAFDDGPFEYCGPTDNDTPLTVTVKTVPPAPTLTATPNPATGGRYRVAWGASAGAASYALEERTGDGPWMPVDGVRNRAVDYANRPVAVYAYRVTACDADGDCGPWSAIATVRVPPAVPANLTATDPDETGRYRVSWNASTGADRYRLDERPDDGGWTEVLEQPSDGDTVRTLSKSTAGTYAYRVQACAGVDNCSAWSATLTVRVPPARPVIEPSVTCADGAHAVSWSAVSDATRYVLDQRLGMNAWSRAYDGDATRAALSLTAGEYYGLRVKACADTNNCSAWSDTLTVTAPDCTAPEEPTELTVVPTGPDSYRLGWAPVHGEAIVYPLQERSGGGDWTDVPEVSGTEKTFTDQDDGEYRYRVRACRTADLCSGWAAFEPVTVPIPRPPAPGNLRASEPNAEGEYTVSWNPSPVATSYVLEEHGGDGAWSPVLDRSSEMATSTTIANEPGTWSYRVKGCAGPGYCGEWSATATVTVPPDPPAAPPTGRCTDGAFELAWAEVPGATRYMVQQRIDGGVWSLAYDGPDNAERLTLTAGETYEIQVRACLDDACSTWGGTVTVIAPDCAEPPVPDGLEIVPTGPDSYRLDWAPVDSEGIAYELQQSLDGGDWMDVPEVSGAEKTFTDQNDGVYRYRVRACKATDNCSAWAGFEPVTVPLPPPAPGNLRITDRTADGGYTVRWDAVDWGNEVTYVLDERTGSGPWEAVHNGVAVSKALTGRAAGVHAYRVRACAAADNCGDWSQILTLTAGGPNAAPAIVLAQRPPMDSASDEVGVTAGAFRVAESGAANYRIPILAAQGIAGLTPQIALVYDSQSGNGLVGQSFFIAGLSAITRCRQTQETDGANDGIGLDAGDRFCLDGQRLVSVGGVYGAADSEYRTEVDAYLKVVAKGGTTGNPAYFEVWRKDGTYSTYGNTANSALEAPGPTGSKILLWARDRLEDSAGNDIDYVYHEDTTTGEHRVVSITYAGGDARIEFEYEDRTDDRSWFVAGSKYQNTKRLKKVKSRNDNLELRTYTLTYAYGAHNDVSQLTHIQECSGTTCYPATEFAWSNPDIGFSGGSTTTHQHGFLGGRPADIDGDGVNELLWVGNDGNSRFYLRLFRFNGSTFVDEDPRPESEIDAGNVKGIRLRSQARDSWTVIDYNNDGRHDLLYMREDKWRLRLGEAGPKLSEEIALIDAPAEDEHAVIVDVDSDGLPDAIRRGTSLDWEVSLMAKDPMPAAPDRPYHFSTAENLRGIPAILPNLDVVGAGIDNSVMDFNADGVADFFVRESHLCEFDCDGGYSPTTTEHYALYASVDGDFTYRRAWTVAKSYFAGPKKGRPHFPDLNGDGYDDVAYARPNNHVVFALSDGTDLGVMRRLPQITLDSDEAEQIRFLDYNGDGRPDLLFPNGGYWQVLEFTGGNFAATPVSTGIRSRDTGDDLDEWRTTFFDGNGDGKPDAIRGKVADRSGGLNTANVHLGAAAYAPANVIETITDGFGAATTVTYKALTDPSSPGLYGRAGDANGLDWGSPVFDVIAPITVVESVTNSAPAAGARPGGVDPHATSSVSYAYHGAKAQAGGRGWLGFGSITSIDAHTGIETKTVYEQRFPLTGRPKATQVRTSGGDLLSQAANTWADFNATGPNHQPYLRRSVEKTHSTSTGNSATGAFTVSDTVLQSVTTDFTMHAVTVDGATVGYGDVDTITVTTTGDGQTYTRVTDNDYLAPDTARWRLGRLNAVNVTHTRDDNNAAVVVRKSSFTYNATTGLLKTETVEPGGAREQTLSTTYLRDSAGNVTEVKQSGYGGLAVGGTAPPTVDRKATTVYDTDKRYVTVQRNHYNHAVETIVARNRYGEPTAIDDVDSHRTDIEYGAMGRETWRRDEVGGYTHRVHRLCSETGIGCPTGARFRIRTETAGGGETIAYYDLLGREIRSSTRMFDGRWSVVLTEYDALGRPVHVSAPFASSDAHAGTASHWTRQVHDHLGRLTQTTHPDNSTDKAAYDGYTTTFTDGLAKTRKEKKNALGELIRIEDHNRGTVTFGYDEQGNLDRSTQGGAGVSDVVTTMGYDLVGRKTSMADPDMGAWRYAYNAFGELVEQTTAKGDCTRIAYDRLGRQVRRIDHRKSATASATAECGDGDFTETSDSGWVYDHAATNGLGKLRREYTEVGTAMPFERTHAYDSHGRPKSTTTEIVRGTATDTYNERATYDRYGRVFQAFDGAKENSGLEYAYNAYGYLLSAKEATNSSGTTHTYYTVTAMDARGNVTGLSKAGLTVNRAFDAETGLPDRFTAKDAGMGTVHDLDFTFDVVGNLTGKRDRSRRAMAPMTGGTHKDIAESYCYDDLHRLTSVHGTATACSTGADETLALTYDALGNIKSKRAYRPDGDGGWETDPDTSVGAYTYHTRPHAVVTAGGSHYDYDANGSMISGGGRTIAYTVFNKPATITKSAAGADDREVLLHYGPNRDRYRRIDTVDPDGTNPSVQTTHYAGTVERIRRPDGAVETKRHLDGELIVTATESAGTVMKTERYLFTDHLGSADLITDRAGAIVQAMSFDAFGLRRKADAFASLTEADRAGFDTNVTTRGFSGHEGLDAVGLVHMNGRVYDPLLGWFVSADPYIPAPHLTQSYNRYSYAMNNPLSYTDPDGYFFKKLFKSKVFRVIVTIVVHLAFDGWTVWVIDSLIQTAIELLPDLGRVNQAFGHGSPSTSILGGPAGNTPGRLCFAANCLDAPTEVHATLGNTVGGESPGMANGAVTTAYLAALTGSADGEKATLPSRIGQTWMIEHPLAAEIAVAFIPFGCAATEEGCSTTDIVLDTVGLIPLLKPVTAAVKILKGASRVRKATKARICSFASGTPVLTPVGLRSIEEVETGDWVLAKDEKTGRVEPKRVNLAYGSVHGDAILLTVRQRDGGEEAILTTSEHPFRVQGQGWVPAVMLSPGDELLVLSGGTVTLDAIEFPVESLTAYNFEVEDFHTYAVGEDGIWVHNACDPKKARTKAQRQERKRRRQERNRHPSEQFEDIHAKQQQRRAWRDNVSISKIEKSRQRDKHSMKPHNIDLTDRD